MLAQFRCDEIASELLNAFSVDLQPLTQSIKSGKIIDNFKKTIEELCTKYKIIFHEKTQRYSQLVVEEKKIVFEQSLYASAKLLYFDCLKIIYKKSLHGYHVALEKSIGDLSESSRVFTEIVADCQFLIISGFQKISQEMIIFEQHKSWDFSALTDELTESISSATERKKAEIINERQADITSTFSQQISESLVLHYEQCKDEEFWQQLQVAFETLCENKMSSFLKFLKGKLPSYDYSL
jgi:protein SEY1